MLSLEGWSVEALLLSLSLEEGEGEVVREVLGCEGARDMGCSASSLSGCESP